MTFDPYADCLNIRPEERPVDFYRLLGVPRFEQDIKKISRAAEARVSLLHSRRTNENSLQIQHVLNEIGEAKRWLLDPRQKTTYDHQLRAMQPTRQPASAEVPLAGPQQYLNPPTAPIVHSGREMQMPSPPVPGGFRPLGEQPLAGPQPIRHVPTPSAPEFPLASPGLPGRTAGIAPANEDQPIAVPRSAPPGRVPSLQEIAARNASYLAPGSGRGPLIAPVSSPQPIQSPPAPAILPQAAPTNSPSATPAATSPVFNEPHARPPEPAPPEAAPPMQGFGSGLPPMAVATPPAGAPPLDSISGPAVVLSSPRSTRRRALGFPLWVPVAGFIGLMLVLGALVGFVLTLTGDRNSPRDKDGSTSVANSPTNSVGADQVRGADGLTAEERRDRIKQQLAAQARQKERDQLERTKDGQIIDPAIGVVVKPPDKITTDNPLDGVVGGTVDDPAVDVQLVRVALPEDTLVDTARASLLDRLAAAEPADLLSEALDDANSLEARYVMLDSARQMAARQGDAQIALRAVDALDRQFKIDSLKLKIETLRGMRQSAGTPAAYGVVVDGAMQVADSIKADANAQAYQQSLSEALIAARKSGDPELVRRVTMRLIGEKQARPVEPAVEDDPPASTAEPAPPKKGKQKKKSKGGPTVDPVPSSADEVPATDAG